jgi:hypothetical protein
MDRNRRSPTQTIGASKNAWFAGAAGAAVRSSRLCTRARSVLIVLLLAVLAAACSSGSKLGSPTATTSGGSYVPPSTPPTTSPAQSTTITEADGFAFVVSATSARGVPQYNAGPSDGTVAADPGSVYLQVSITVTNKENDRSTNLTDLLGSTAGYAGAGDTVALGLPGLPSSVNCASPGPGGPVFPPNVCFVGISNLILSDGTSLFENTGSGGSLSASATTHLFAYYGPVPSSTNLSGARLYFQIAPPSGTPTLTAVPVS